MFAILNRLRGTKGIYAKAYGVFIGLILYFMSDSITASIIVTIVFILGESFGWGKWLGSIAYSESINIEDMHKDTEGHNNGIHWIANRIAPELDDYQKYCKVALAIRGLYWWLPVYLVFSYYEQMLLHIAIIGSIVIGILFPTSVIIAREYEYKIPSVKTGMFSVDGVWEKSEVVYGLFSGIILVVLIFSSRLIDG